MADANEPKKETVRITLPPRRADAGDPEENDVVRINLPPRPPTSEAASTPAPVVPRPGNITIPQPSVEQNPLPKAHVGGGPAPMRTVPPPPPPAPPAPPVAKTPVPRPIGTTGAGSAPGSVPLPTRGPAASTTPAGKDTARISVLPDPPKPSASNMSKTQPLVTLTDTPVVPPTAPVRIAPAVPPPIGRTISMPLCWALVGISAAILIIEIWNYIS